MSLCLITAVLLSAGGAAAAPSFQDRTAQIVPGLGTGAVSWGDFDNDGYVDVYDGAHVWRNNGGTNFTSFADVPGVGNWADYDNDGFLDIGTRWGDVFHNDAATGFSSDPFPPVPMTYTRGSSWGDFNGDGYVDIYIGGYENPGYQPDAIFTNNGDRTFSQTWVQTGDIDPARGISVCDFDQDGDTDIYVSNYRLERNILWQNNGTGTFTNVADSYGATGGYGHSIGADWGDMDNDGNIDLFAGNFSHSGQPQSKFLRNTGPAGNYHFEDRSGSAGLAWQESYASPTLGDYDNDGYLDLFFTTVYGGNTAVLYRNNGDWTFTDVTSIAGLGGIGASFNYQASWADFDNDGDLDLATEGKLFVNNATDVNSNHWLKVQLRGDGVTINSAAIGAQVRITLPNGEILTRQVPGSVGEGNQNDLTMHFGLGSHSGPVDLEIFWPGGTVTEITGVLVDDTYTYTPDPAHRWKLAPLVHGNWADSDNWSLGLPDAESETHIDNGGKSLITSGGQACDALFLGYEGGDEGYVALLGGYLITDTTNVGWGGTGTFRQDGGNHVAVTELVVAGQSGSEGTYEMIDGTLSVGRMVIGAAGAGQMSQSGGTITGDAAAVLAVGNQAGGDGTYFLYGTGKVLVPTLYVGNGGTGQLLQAGPTSVVVAEEVTLGRLADSSGTYSIGGGVLAVEVLYIGWEGFGELEQLGGTVGAGIVLVGTQTGSIGVLDISGGAFAAENLSVGSVTPGVLSISDAAAEITVSEDLSLGVFAGVYAVDGATIHMTGSSFDNRNTQPHSLAELANLRLIYESEGETDSFEVAGLDLGAALAGFEENFTLGALQLGSEDGVGRVRLVDAFDNQTGWGGSEALYVKELIMGAGAVVALNGLNLYYLNEGDPKQFLMGDANLDGVVNDVDLTALASNWLGETATWENGDFNGDGLISDLDLTILALAWPGGDLDVSAVPEPSTCALIAAGALLLLTRMRHRRP